MSKELILIVEDDEKSRKLLRDILGANGYEVIESDNAEDGIELVRSRRPALVLMDIHLPGISGIEALRILRADPSTAATPVVAVTASVMPQDQSIAFDAGFNAFESKPISISAMLTTVRRQLDEAAKR
jgi:two-component system cell cycle response regulator DivK